jgi:hypothetical protein
VEVCRLPSADGSYSKNPRASKATHLCQTNTDIAAEQVFHMPRGVGPDYSSAHSGRRFSIAASLWRTRSIKKAN